jgi:glycosyltransferase involved in cell wall biosynthesis
MTRYAHRPRRVSLNRYRPVIYVCIPTHNEAATIGVLLWKTRKVLGEFGREYRLVVQDDGSDDDTADVLQRYRRALPLTVLRSNERIGYGPSVERLLRHVREESPYPKRDCAVVIQGDFTESPDHIVSLVKQLEGGADIVAGAIESDDAPQGKGMKLARWAARTFLRRVVAGAPVSDPLAGLRAYRVIVLKKALRDRADDDPLIQSDGWAANVELLGRLAPHARRISEVPLNLRYDLQTRPSRFRAWKTFVALARLPGSLWSSPGPEAA